MEREALSITTDEDLPFMEMKFSTRNLQHKHIIRLQTVLNPARSKSTNDTVSFFRDKCRNCKSLYTSLR